jgi:predicted ATP-grasp superfamily ATP-dependent carboligase
VINTSSINTSTPVLLLRSARHGGLAITRTLGRLGVKVYVIDADTRAPSFFSKYCRGRFVWDFDQAPEAHSLEYLAAIGRALERPAILLPTADTTALFVATHASELQQRFLFPA